MAVAAVVLGTVAIVVLGLVLGSGAALIAVWQSWSMTRRQDVAHLSKAP